MLAGEIPAAGRPPHLDPLPEGRGGLQRAASRRPPTKPNFNVDRPQSRQTWIRTRHVLHHRLRRRDHQRRWRLLWQPFEFLIIVGAAVGGFIISNRKPVLSGAGKAIGGLLKGEKYDKAAYLELLSLLYAVFKLSKTKGALALEQHVEKPDESTLFAQYPKFNADHHAIVFLCDYLRLLTLGTDNHHEMEALMDEEIETHHEEQAAIAAAIQTIADALPALGIVAAVLGVIHTMGSISEPPEVLGHLIGGALFAAPMAGAVKARFDAEAKYFICMKSGILAYMQGYAPAVAVEFARKALNSDVRPSFYEVETACEAGPTPLAAAA